MYQLIIVARGQDFKDTNSNFLAKKCFEHGLRLKHIRVIPDDIEIISKTVIELSENYDLLFTSGGIGPTHDDLTYESISKAFNLPLITHSPTVEAMKTKLSLTELSKGHENGFHSAI